MFEKIFGPSEEEKELEKLRAELEEKNQKLEKLEKEAGKERRRAKEAVTEKQQTDKELKEARHKIESLEDRIKNLEEEEKGGSRNKKVKFLTRSELTSLIEELGSLSADSEGLKTHFVVYFDSIADDKVVQVLRGTDSQTGYVHLQDQFKVIDCVLIPPLPVDEEFYRDNKFHLEKIREDLESDVKIGFLSVHAGESAVGMLEGNEFSNFNIVKTGVGNKHSKGGFSQGRFERGRDEQIQKHLKEVVNSIEESMTHPDYLILDGNERMVSELKDQLSIETSIIQKSLDIGSVNENNKDEYVEKIWGARIYIL